MLSTLVCSLGLEAAEEVDVSQLPPAADRQIDYLKDIKPILKDRCYQCHGSEDPKSDFSLVTRESALEGGDNGVAIIPGNSAESPLIHYVAHLVELMEMPPLGEAEPLNDRQISLLRAWIDQGVPWSDSGELEKLKYSVTPAVQWVTVSGNERMFREHWWQSDGWSGGAQSFEMEKRFDLETRLRIEGRALFEKEDYRLSLDLKREDLGFIRAGYEQFRKYYDDTGGFYEPFDRPAPRLDRDLYLDTGKAWVDLGLTLPEAPRVTLGYEYQYKDGTKSTLQWGGVQGGGGDTKAVHPAYKDIEEDVHILKADVSYEAGGVLIEDNFRGEFRDLETRRVNVDSFSLGRREHEESYEAFQGANVFRLEKELRDWWYMSGGYLYSHLDGDGAFSQATFFPASAGGGMFFGDRSQAILLEKDSHVINVNSRWGPLQDLTFSAGVQNEWTRQDGFATGLAFNTVPTHSWSDIDKRIFEETFGLRYTRIPHTVWYIDTRFRQESIGHYEQRLMDDGFGGSQDFLRDTDATADLKEYRTGFTVSPWSRVSLGASYQRSFKQNDYDHLTDTDQSANPGNGYPAFIRTRDLATEEVETRLVWRMTSWLKSTLKYQYTTTDYRTVTDSSFVPGSGQEPGGRLLAGDFRAHVYSLNTTFTPWQRLYLSGTLSYRDTELISGINNGAQVVPYSGDVYSVLSSATFVLTSKVDLTATYTFSKADYGQDNELSGLPLGIVYDQHGVLAGLTRHWRENLSTRLQYGYFEYDEPTSGGIRDYVAHAILASCTWRIP